jgi:flagellar motility protein MotE (MotC chaperone)
MTGAGKTRWPTGSVVVLFVAAGGAFAPASTVSALAQGWEPTVSVGSAASKAPARPLAAAKIKPTTLPLAAVEMAPEPKTMPEERRGAAPRAMRDSTASLETGSITGARPDDYCTNIANPAADARFAWQKKTLTDMEQEITKRIALLEEKTAEYQKWLARRDEFSKKANETVLRIYARMRPDAAAVQLAALDEETAASVLTKLDPRAASLILNEMESAQAVRLTATISGAAKVAPVAPKIAIEAKAK